jgi:hypothetical protein
MDKKNLFTDGALGEPADEDLFMSRFERNLSFEKRAPTFTVTPWSSGLFQVLSSALVFAVIVAALGLFVPERIVFHSLAVLLVVVVAYSRIKEEFFSR